MHTARLLESWLERNCSFIHSARLGALVKVVDSLLYGGKATLAELGRGVRNHVSEKHNIKCADRLVGNRHLANERLSIYQQIANRLLCSTARPWIIVDWSDVELGHEFLMLKAAVPVGGRAMTVYEEVHPLSRYNNPVVHQRFLERLALIVPKHCLPIVVTDAGFRGPWFKAVEALEWDWVGRVRNMILVQREDTNTWQSTRSIYAQATRVPRFMGRCRLSKRHPYACYLHLYRSNKKHAKTKSHRRRALSNGERTRRHGRDPWLIATSMAAHYWTARRIVKAYEKRMQIEATFRDIKSHRWGYGLQYARSNSVQRLGNLLLLTTLAVLATWLVGLAAQARDWARHFQANTLSTRAVLSVFFLGRRVLQSKCFIPESSDIRKALEQLTCLVYNGSRIA